MKGCYKITNTTNGEFLNQGSIRPRTQELSRKVQVARSPRKYRINDPHHTLRAESRHPRMGKTTQGRQRV